MLVYGLIIVRNGVDIVRLNLLYHLSLGVDRMFVVDNGSTDGTDRVIRQLSSQDPRVRWSRDDGAFRQGEITTELAHEAFREGADWFIAIDVDEFWYPPGGDFRSVLERSRAVALMAQRVNFVQRRERRKPSPDALLHMTRRAASLAGPPRSAQKLVESREIAFVESELPPKWIMRPTAEIRIPTGSHKISGVDGPVAATEELLVLHAPLRSRAALVERVRSAGRTINETGHRARYWLMLGTLEGKESAIEQEWSANSYQDNHLDVYGERHPVIFDPRLRDAVAPLITRPWWNRLFPDPEGDVLGSAASSDNEPHLNLTLMLTCDEPVDGSEVMRGTVVSGWAFSPAGIRQVSVRLRGRGRVVGEAELGFERPDVAADHPEWAGARHSGFRYRLESVPVNAEVSTELVVVAEDNEGRWTEVRRVLRVKERGEAAERIEQTKRAKRKNQETFELQRKLRALEKGGVESEPVTGALPDFVVIGGQKCGTTFFYDLLTQHAFVEPAATKELHFFDLVFELGVEWYRRCFPAPGWKDERKTITGEATPNYLFHPHAARRMAEVVPRARLIALLRNPIDRAYSMYYQQVSKGYETLEFEEAIEAEEARLRGEESRLLEDEHHASFDLQNFSYLSRGIYIDQLLRWSEFFPREQMLVLRSEDLFESSQETFNTVLEFLDLPHWDFQGLLVPMIPNKGEYEKMNPSTRQYLEEYFEPHNKRLYEFLGRDFGW